MSNSSPPPASVEEVRNYLAAELERAQTLLLPDQWQAILIGVGDQGAIAAFPCRLALPFHYPASIEELDQRPTNHFVFVKKPLWSLRRHVVREFAEQYERFAALD